MLEIRTITSTTTSVFDMAVNQAIKEGWELTRRECFITGADRAMTLYAELERLTDEPEAEEEPDDTVAQWTLTRNPRHPFRCSACGYAASEQWRECPGCERPMVQAEG